MTNKTWRESCRKLQWEGVKFEILTPFGWATRENLGFTHWPITDFLVKQQPIPDRPDWREWCKRLQMAGVVFEWLFSDGAVCGTSPELDFTDFYEYYRIAQQPIPVI